MAIKKQVKFKGFVSIALGKAEKEYIKKNPITDLEFVQFLTDAAELGYKVSVSYSNDGGFFTLTLYGNHEDNPNAGYAASLRHSDLMIAAAAMVHTMGEEGTKDDWQERFTIQGDDDW